MAKNNNISDFMRGIADVLRAVKGDSALINPQDFENEICSAIVNTPSLQTITERQTANGADIEDGVAFIKSIRGNSLKVGNTIKHFSARKVVSKDADGEQIDTLNLASLDLWSAGSKYDEVDLAKGTKTKRIGKIDLGTLNWDYDSNNQRYYTEGISPNTKVIADYTNNAMLLGYQAGETSAQYGAVNHSFSGINNVLFIYNTDVADAAALKSSLNGVYLYYELQTPTTFSFTKQKAYYKVKNGGREMIVRESRNIWDSSQSLLSGKYADNNAIQESGGFKYRVIKVEKNTNYTLKVFGTFTDSLFCGFVASQTPSVGDVASSFRVSLNYAETANSGNYEYLLVAVWRDHESVLSTLQIEEGSTAHSYEPYGMVTDTDSSPLKAEIGYKYNLEVSTISEDDE